MEKDIEKLKYPIGKFQQPQIIDCTQYQRKTIMKLVTCFIFILLASACVPKYGINEQTSEIGSIDAKSVDRYNHVIDSMNQRLDISELDSMWQAYYFQLDTNYFLDGDVIYFDENPRELVLVDFYSVRAIYNPKIYNDCPKEECILNGNFRELDSLNRIRIVKRVNALFSNNSD